MTDIYSLKKIIKNDLEELKRLRELSDMISSADPSKEWVSGGPIKGCRFANIVDQIVDLEKKIEAELQEYLEYEQKVREAENPVYKLFLQYKMEGLTNEEIADMMGYSVRQIYNIQKDCIKLHLFLK